MKIKNVKMIDVSNWDDFVSKTYGRPYNFQQQDGCKSRGTYSFSVPLKHEPDDFENDSISEEEYSEEMGVSFAAWLARDPKQKLIGQEYNFELELWWKRNFYPCIDMIIKDLYKRGLIEAGDYIININW